MKKSDIERMISLADDRYIDEIFQDKITGRRKNIFVTFTAVAAALALVAGGISYLVSNVGNPDKITANDPIISEVGAVDYRSYFQNYDESAVEVDNDEWSIKSAGIFCYFSNSESEYVKSVMPFDMGGFVNADCNFYYDHKDELKTISIYANDKADDSQENVKMLYIDAHREGEFFPHLRLENCKSMKRFDVDVYGFDLLETDNTLGVLFASNGREYLISGDHMSYDEIGVIMDSIIINGLWADRFDLSKAEMEYYDIRTGITLAEANEIAPFAGHVPNIENIGGMNIGSSKGAFYYAVRNENNEAMPASLTITYSSSNMDGGWNDEIHNDMVVVFYTDKANIKPFKNIFKLEDAENVLPEWKIPGIVYAFTIDCGNFMVNIETENCDDNELLSYITAIRIGANGVIGNASGILSLAEANTIAPFAGYVPQAENIGGMRLVSIYSTESSFNGSVDDNSIIFNYLQEETNKYITLYYTCGDAVPNSFFAESFTAEQLESIEQQSELGDPNCFHYAFSLECGDFRINVKADCTHYEMEQCMSEINFRTYDSITLAEANNIAPYSGFVPQVEKVGDMKLGLVQYNGSNIVLDYSFQSENRFSYIGLTYSIYEDVPLNYSVITVEQLKNGDIRINKDDSEDGRYNYNFAVDCGGMYGRFYVCIDGEKCTTAELYDCILTLLMDKSSLAGDINSSDYTPFGTLEEANKLEPFAGYVPTSKTIGDMKIYTGGGSEVMSAETEEDGRMLRITYQSEVKSGNVYGEYDFKSIGATYSEKKYYIDTTDPVITVEKLPWANLDDLKTDGIREGGRVCYRFIIDCGTCYIYVAADCLPGEMKQFIGEITGTAVRDADDEDVKILTIYKVKELAKKGDDLTWSDFDGYTFTEGGSGLYIKSYSVEGGYNLMIGGEGRETKPMYIYLTGNGKQRIDIRYDSIDDFLADDKGENLLTMDKVKELAKKGDDLTWSDFEAFSGADVGSGLYIMAYHVEGTDYTVAVGGGSLDEKPMYIHLGRVNGNYIDIRYDSIDDFLNGN